MIIKDKNSKTRSLYSSFLKRLVEVEVIESGCDDSPQALLLLNDGQLACELNIHSIAKELNSQERILPLKIVAIHAGERQSEYGITGSSDYLGRGDKAGQYENFIINELLPWLHHDQDAPMQTAFAGFSLGGLSAFDIAISNPSWFSATGVFSGSFWWRSKSYDQGYTDTDRLIFEKLSRATLMNYFRCYLMAGTNDERNDRNGNGIIDAVDDTLDVFEMLVANKNISRKNLQLAIVDGGQHNPQTWARMIPEFLLHSFGKGRELSNC